MVIVMMALVANQTATNLPPPTISHGQTLQPGDQRLDGEQAPRCITPLVWILAPSRCTCWRLVSTGCEETELVAR
jgi:hypothetical protein